MAETETVSMDCGGDQLASVNFYSVGGLVEAQKSVHDVNKEQLAQLLNQYLPQMLETATERFEQNFSAKDRMDALDLLCSLVSNAMSSMSATEVLECHQVSLLSALNKAPVRLRETIIKELVSLVDREPDQSISLLCGGSVAVLVAVQRTLTQSDGSWQLVQDFITKIASHPNGPNLLFATEPFVSELKSQLEKGDTIRFRVHDLTVSLCKISARNLDLCASVGLVPALVSELDREGDVLAQLNCLEMLADLTSSASFAADYLHKVGVIPRLHSLLEHIQTAPDGGFLFPAVIRFFGYMSRSYPLESSDNYPRFMQSLFQLVLNFEHVDVPQRLLGFDTLAVFGSTPAGKDVLAKNDKMEEAMRNFGRAITVGPLELRVRHIEALTLLLSLPLNDQTSGLLEVTERWYHKLNRDTSELVFNLFKQPIQELHLSIGHLYRELAVQPWAQKLMAQQPGFLEYLLNRATEHQMDGRHIKFEIISKLVDSPTVNEAFDTTDVLKLNQYKRNGPYYVQSETEVALEGGNA